MWKKRFALLLAALLGLPAGGAAAITVGVAPMARESDWRMVHYDDMFAAIKAEGWTLMHDGPSTKVEDQEKALRRYVSQGVDCILLTCVGPTGLEEVLQEVNEAQIPLILIDRFPACMDQIAYAGAFRADFVEEGRRMAYWTANYLESAGRGDEEINVVILEGTTGSSAAEDRTAGIHEVLAGYPNLKVVGSQTGNFHRAEGRAVMEGFLQAIDKIDVVLAENDDMGLGAIEAIRAAGKAPGEDIIVVGCDAVRFAFAAIAAGEMNATIECTPIFSSAVIPLIKGLEAGEAYGREIIHPQEGCFDAYGGIPYTAAGDALSVKAADVMDTRLY